MAKITVDTGRCIGSGQCAFSVPAVFDQSESGIVSLLVAEPDDALLDEVHEAALICPSQSISVSDD